MDYSEIDIYNKDKFILHSEIRNMDFPFIRYKGNNYEELNTFITSFSPNTVIDPNVLKSGELYTYSAKYFTLQHVPISELRCVIASNPYLVKDNGDCIPLALDRNQAEAFLKENRHHKMFTYENILETYTYSPERSAYMVYNRQHPKGMVSNQLPEYYEWYIGRSDYSFHCWKNPVPEYDEAHHLVHVRPSFDELVRQIEKEEYKINKKRSMQGLPILFPRPLNSWSRHNKLIKVCLNKGAFKVFLSNFYFVIEPMKSGSPSTTKTLSEYADSEFIKTVKILYDFYNLGEVSDDNSTSQAFQKYLEHNQGPNMPNEYAKLQEGILTDYLAFLRNIQNTLTKKLTISGKICQDEQKNLYCGKAILPNTFYPFRGCQCKITSLTKNNDASTNSQYPYFSNKLDSVDIYRKGTISKDKEGTMHVEEFILNGTADEHIGDDIMIRAVRPFAKPRGGYLGEVIEFDPVPEYTIAASIEQKIDKKYQYKIPPDVFDESKKVIDDTRFIGSLASKITTAGITNFQDLFWYVLSLGKIEDKDEQDAMLTFLTGYDIQGATSTTVRWCCDDYRPRVLFYIVKHITDDTAKNKYNALDKVDFYTTTDAGKESMRRDINLLKEYLKDKDGGTNISAVIEKGFPSGVKTILNKLIG